MCQGSTVTSQSLLCVEEETNYHNDHNEDKVGSALQLQHLLKGLDNSPGVLEYYTVPHLPGVGVGVVAGVGEEVGV